MNLSHEEIEEKDEEMSRDDLREQAKQFLALTHIVDKYPQVVARRIAGLVYILIGGGLSLATLLLLSIMVFIDPIMDSLTVAMIFVGCSLFIAWFIAFRLVSPITRSYPRKEPEEKTSTIVKVTWGIITPLIVILAWHTFGTGIPELFPPLLQMMVGTGSLANYIDAKRSSDQSAFALEHLVFAVVVLVSIVPIVLFPSLGYFLLILFDMGTIYSLGIYMMISAEKILLDSSGSE